MYIFRVNNIPFIIKGRAMKKILLTLITAAAVTGTASADQLSYITKEQAEKGAAFIRSQREVLSFCGCCGNEPEVYIRIKSVTIQPAGYENYYQIIIKGETRDEQEVSIEADLAYIHVNRKGRAVAICRILGFECDPCTSDLRWNERGKQGG